ncbi:hypothetical protein DH86_00003875 [Scytalidium sp. 3C]|nr:hypothetical protein DH86_00003875 [Scytalidium sp. 3C]
MFLKDPTNKVIATARSTAGSKGLQDLASKYSKDRLILLDLDVTKLESVKNVAQQLDTLLPEGLDNLISNAGISNQSLTTYDELDLEEFENELHFNTIVPIQLLRAFLPSIKKSKQKKIAVITSLLGSIEVGAGLPNLANAYAVSKAALNMLIRKWGAVLKGEGVTSILIHPGWVGATEVGNTISSYIEKYAPDVPNIPVEESAEGVIKVIREATLENTGTFYNFDGTNIPW